MSRKLGRVAPVYRGQYEEDTQYEALDVVELNGNSWVALESVENVVPGTNDKYWAPSSVGHISPEVLEILSLDGIFNQCYSLEYIKLYEWMPKHSSWLQDAGRYVSSPTIYLPTDAQPYESYQDRSGGGIPENWSIEYYS